jgi:hypothetical protein
MSPWNHCRAANFETNGVVKKEPHAWNNSDRLAKDLPFDVSILWVPMLAGPSSISNLKETANKRMNRQVR